METTKKVRFDEAAKKATKEEDLSLLYGLDIFELDSSKPIGTGSFSKCRSKLDSLDNTIKRIIDLQITGCRSDLLITYHKWDGYIKAGWQVWERRQDTSCRVETPTGGTRMPKKSLGTGRIYILKPNN